MARRGNRENSGRRPSPEPPNSPRRPSPIPSASGSVPDPDEPFFPGPAEACRRLALGGLALLVVARAFFPSEDADQGTGLPWVLLMVGLGGLAVVGNLLAGSARFRWSWVDGAVYLLMALVAVSVRPALDQRPAIILAWEWAGLGLLYFLARNLPRTRAESSDLALILAATAVALAGYGLFQVGVELPGLRAQYGANPVEFFRRMQVDPASSFAEGFRQRLMHSTEPFSTFGLANSLAGVLVAALTLLGGVALENLRRDEAGPRWGPLALALIPGLALGVCLILTKSRSGYVGLLAGALVLAWQYRTLVPRRVLVGGGLGLGAVLAGLIALGVASRQLDVQVLTEARKSLGYRWEYWVGTWGILTDAPPPYPVGTAAPGSLGGTEVVASPNPDAFWRGVGPGNFAGAYLRHKLPEASEEIRDPHNLVLEVWAASGLPAAVVLVLALAGGAWAVAGRRGAIGEGDAGPAPRREHWRVLLLGALGWFGVWFLGRLDPINNESDLRRWAVLGLAWFAGLGLLLPIWNRRGAPAAGLGAAVVALGVNLLAAGGIGIPSVAMVLWLALALGLNLRDDRPAGRVREARGLGLGVALACGWAALAGTFFGTVLPIWRSDADLARGNAIMNRPAPDFEGARVAYLRALDADRHATEPLFALADLEYRYWRSPESQARHKDNYTKVLLTLDKALDPQYRNPYSLAARQRQAMYARTILGDLPEESKATEQLGLLSTIARASRQAVRLYPTSAALRADLALASADLGMYRDAVAEGRAALALDDRMPHRDRKLPRARREALDAALPTWEAKAKEPPPSAAEVKQGRR